MALCTCAHTRAVSPSQLIVHACVVQDFPHYFFPRLVLSSSNPGNVILSVALVTVNKIVMRSYGFRFV
jgi:hypothetical protein